MRRSLAVLFGAFLTMVGCRDPYVQVPIAPTATVTQDWTEVRPRKPLHWTKPVQEFSFHIDTPHQQSTQVEIVGPGGEHFIPEVELITMSGKTMAMQGHGFWGEEMYFDWGKGGSGMGPIQAIRIRSRVPLQISNLIWRGYDPAEVKR
jgi:hypothetical protein